jgi:hypothetical protein
MIKAKDQAGRALEFSVSGRHDDDLEINEIYYLEGDDQVDDETCEWVLDAYATEAHEYWREACQSAAEDYCEGDR